MLFRSVIDNNRPIPPGTVYFPQYLQKAGYATCFIGKWHMGGESDAPQPGWDHWISFRGQGEYLPPTPNYTLNVDGKRVKQKGYITDELTDYAIEWLKQQKPAEKPFFLYLSHKAVHANFTPEPKYDGKFKDLKFARPATEASTPTNLLQPRWLRDQRNSWHGVDFPYHSELDIEGYYKRYCETLCSVDDSIGRVLQQLKDMGIYDDTLVIYMGDNVFMFGEHGLIDKRAAYEESMRVPMLMRCPSLFPAGSRMEQVVANIDIAPTMLAAAGLVVREKGRGTRVRSSFEGKVSRGPTEFLLAGRRAESDDNVLLHFAYEPAPAEAAAYAHDLYSNLRSLDASGSALIVVEEPPRLAEWAAVNDRLGRAATGSRLP